jgi:hypothetical protein
MRTEKAPWYRGLAKSWITRGSMVAMGLLTTVASAQNFAPIAPFKSLCIEDAATGFNWTAGKWKQANFKVGDRYIVSKLSAEEAKRIAPVQCASEKIAEPFFGMRSVAACYTIKAFGEEVAQYLDGETCQESYIDDVLVSVKCERLTFLPNGDFIKLPWHANIGRKPKNDYKDSLVLSVGVCNKIS